VEQCGSDVEIFIELVLQVEAEQCLALHREERLVFERHRDILTRVYDALVGDGHDTHRIIYRIVGVLCQPDAAGRDHYRAAGHIHRVKTYLRPRRCLILAVHHKFVLVGKLAGNYKRRVIKLFVDILRRYGRIAYLLLQMRAKRLHYRKYDFALRRLDCVTLDEVKETVGI
jgi:hypothetical protein